MFVCVCNFTIVTVNRKDRKCIYSCVCVCAHMCEYTHTMWLRGQKLMPGVLPQSYVLWWGLPLNLTLTEELDSLTSEFQGSSCLYLFRAEIIDVCSHFCFIMWCWGLKIWAPWHNGRLLGNTVISLLLEKSLLDKWIY